MEGPGSPVCGLLAGSTSAEDEPTGEQAEDLADVIISTNYGADPGVPYFEGSDAAAAATGASLYRRHMGVLMAPRRENLDECWDHARSRSTNGRYRTRGKRALSR
jgi:hypothetical protein